MKSEQGNLKRDFKENQEGIKNILTQEIKSAQNDLRILSYFNEDGVKK